MTQVVRVGLDIAKSVFQLHGTDANGLTVVRRKLRRGQLVDHFKTLPPCVIGIEACGSAHHWARTLGALGHEVRLIAPAFVKPFVKSQKNDAADAEAICDAVGRPNMRFVAIKTVDQQGILVVHRTRDLLTRQRTMLINAFRSHIAEFGEVANVGARGVSALMQIIETDRAGLIPVAARPALELIADEIRHLSERVKVLECQIEAWHRASPASRRLATIPGIGTLTASALAASIPDPSQFKSGKALGAWLGLVPRQRSSGGVTKLGRITKRGDRYLRRLLTLGARSVLVTFKCGRNKLPPRLAHLLDRKPFKVAIVALANKMARTVWALLHRGENYKPAALQVGHGMA